MSKVNIMAKVIEIAEKREALELSKDEIELASIKELTKSTGDIEKMISKLKPIAKKVQEFNKVLSTAKGLVEDAYSLSNKNVSIGKDFVSSYKALGLDIGDLSSVKGFMENGRLRTAMTDLARDIDKITNKL